MPTTAHDSLASGELERQIFRREGPEEVRRIEGLARRKSTAGASSSVENPLDGFDDEWRGEGIDVASLRDRPADPASVPDNNVDQEGLRDRPLSSAAGWWNREDREAARC